MLITFLIAKLAFKMELLNILGALTGGMTSTPALGALIEVADTDDKGSPLKCLRTIWKSL